MKAKPQTDIVCLDDLQVICGDREWEEALFHCFNRLREHEHKLLICANQNPAQLAIKLPDLRSRLATGLIYQLPVMTDALKQQALISHAQSRGLILPEEVAQSIYFFADNEKSSFITGSSLVVDGGAYSHLSTE